LRERVGVRGLSIAILALLILMPAACALCAQENKLVEASQVTAEGQADASAPDARDKAVADALRNAVMKRIGAYVESTTIGENFEVIQDEILLKANGFAVLDSIESSSERGGVLTVKIKATVSNRPLAERLKALGLTHEWKVGVCILGGRAAETAVIGRLLKAGFRVIDESQRKRLQSDEAAKRASEGDPSALAAIAREYDVDIFIAGEAEAEHVDESVIGGVTFYRSRGRIAARAYYTDTGELLTAEDKVGEAADQTRNLAAEKCLKDTGEKIGSELAGDILIAPAELVPFVSLKISGFQNVSTASDFENALKNLRGVTRVRRQRFTDGVLELNLYVKSDYRDRLPAVIEDSSIGRKLGIEINSWSKTHLQGRVTKTPTSTAHYHRN
jgi:hypothetical protein